MIDLSVVIPNRNSPFLTKTIRDILEKAVTNIEVIINVDEKWSDEIVKDERVVYIHPNPSIGLREGINTCVKLANGKYILKCDDHVMFASGFDKILLENHLQDNWVQIPRRYALDVEKWAIENPTNAKYPVDYMYIDFPQKGKEHDNGMHGVPWKRPERDQIEIDDTPSMQGSCYFMTKNHFDNFLHGLSEEGYGQFAQESQEIGFKTWLGGGALKVNKKTYYCHLHKGNRYGRFYQFPTGTINASNWSAEHWLNNREPNMIYPFSWFINEKFSGMPSWPADWEQQIKNMGWIN